MKEDYFVKIKRNETIITKPRKKNCRKNDDSVIEILQKKKKKKKKKRNYTNIRNKNMSDADKERK